MRRPWAESTSNFVAERPTLVIFESDELPVGCQWLAPGEATVPDDQIYKRVLQRESSTVSTVKDKISVIICTRDRPAELARCLGSFAHQSRVPDEIVVVDNASEDESIPQICRAAGVTYVREDRVGLDVARNTGVAASTGSLILYTDDDTLLHRDWVRNLTGAFADPGIMAATGLVLPYRLDTESRWLFERGWSFSRGYDAVEFGEEYWDRHLKVGCPAWELGAGASMAFRREVFDRVGLFDVRLDVGQAGCSGDSEFWYRLLSAGYRCRYEPTAVVYHDHRATMQGLARQLRAYMRGHTAALLIQYQRTGQIGNLRRLLYYLPRHLLGLAWGRLLGRVPPESRFLREQITGAVAGIGFFFRNRHVKASEESA